MEIRVDINDKVVAWLASMGYPVMGLPVHALRGMLLREARQWQLSPDRLVSMIVENSRQREDPAEYASFIRDAQAIPRRRGGLASAPH
jgi:hypothetical protein